MAKIKIKQKKIFPHEWDALRRNPHEWAPFELNKCYPKEPENPKEPEIHVSEDCSSGRMRVSLDFNEDTFVKMDSRGAIELIAKMLVKELIRSKLLKI